MCMIKYRRRSKYASLKFRVKINNTEATCIFSNFVSIGQKFNKDTF